MLGFHELEERSPEIVGRQNKVMDGLFRVVEQGWAYIKYNVLIGFSLFVALNGFVKKSIIVAGFCIKDTKKVAKPPTLSKPVIQTWPNDLLLRNTIAPRPAPNIKAVVGSGVATRVTAPNVTLSIMN